MSEWLQTYNELFGMYNAGIITSIFGSFAVTFTVIFCWPKLVRDFGAKGGFIAAALIIGTFWLVNHKLPGFGFSTGLAPDANGLPMQCSLGRYGLGHRDGICGLRYALRPERPTSGLIERSIPALGGYHSRRDRWRYSGRTDRIYECCIINNIL